jgi:proteasome lid subunit RPN8/RPN11
LRTLDVPLSLIAYNQKNDSRNMTHSATDSTILIWAVPECPFAVESSARVLDDIRLAIMDAFFSLPRGGAEIGGILLGTFESGRLAISGYAPLDCEHAYGPSFTLSPPDEARLEQLLSSHANLDGGVRPVGWYHSHTRSEIFLSDADLKIHQRFFPESWQVALVLKPHTFQPTRIGFFFREADGSVHASASYREEMLEALPIRQVPSGAPPVPPSDELPRHFRQEQAPEPITPEPITLSAPVAAPTEAPLPAAELLVAPPPVAEPVVMQTPRLAPDPPAQVTVEATIPLPDPPVANLQVPNFVVASASSSRRWLVTGIGIVAFLGTIGAAFQIRQMWLPRVLAAMRPASAVSTKPVTPAPAPAPVPAPPTLGLNTIDREGQLQISWDRTSPSVQHATDAVLEISEGGPQPTAIPLDAVHLQAGSFTYARTAEKVDVKLIVHQAKGQDFREVTSFLGKLPERKPVEDPATRKQREEMARQAAKLKADLSLQAARTKKLEKDVKSMRDEMRRQQLRRMTNQAGDK